MYWENSGDEVSGLVFSHEKCHLGFCFVSVLYLSSLLRPIEDRDGIGEDSHARDTVPVRIDDSEVSAPLTVEENWYLFGHAQVRFAIIQEVLPLRVEKVSSLSNHR